MGLFRKALCEAAAQDVDGNWLTCGARRRTVHDWPLDLRTHGGDEHLDLECRWLWRINPDTGFAEITGVAKL